MYIKKGNGVAARNNDLVCAFIDCQSDYKNKLKLSDSETLLPGTKSSVFFGFTPSWLPYLQLRTTCNRSLIEDRT